MTTSSSYNLEQFNIDSEMRRLSNQVLMFWKQEAQVLTRFGLQDGMSVLELGSGPGFYTQRLLAFLPHSSITSVEISPAMLQLAQKHLQGMDERRWQSLEASIMDMGLPDASVDFAIARFLFEHLPDPVGAASEVLRVLKPGGKLVIIDVDDGVWGVSDPPIAEEIEAIWKKLGAHQAKQGGNRYIGRRLWRILRAAGFHDLVLEVIASHSDELGIETFLAPFEIESYAPLVEAGVLSEQEYEMLRNELQTSLSAPESYCLALLFAVCGEKREEPALMVS